MDCKLYNAYLNILREELVPAMGCTEPIALAYAAASARALLGRMPERVQVEVSGNLIKNAMGVTVPNTDGMRGIEAAVAAGIVAGNEKKKLECIADVDDGGRDNIRAYLAKNIITVELCESDLAFDCTVKVEANGENALIRMANAHTNIVHREKNGEIISDTPVSCESEDGMSSHECLTVENIIKFAEEVELSDVEPILARQIECNSAISSEGLKNPWGACIGQTLLSCAGDSLMNRAKARAAAGSDARMNGCAMPVVILSGSGNQGMTASLPVITYAEEQKRSREELLRALVVSDLCTIHLKTYIGRLSAFCGAVCAGAGAGAGICFLEGGRVREVSHTLVNALGISSGIVCDGAKASCAGKIALAVEAGILGWEMFKNGGKQFYSGEGIITKGVENTIRNVGILGHDGMKATDRTIMDIMLKKMC
ncbi:MAG: serine dehydratase subunit alpha family protein [Clostridia bacterium]|nr:serine dehydratase subunit alpha family protein [Clostridia bacterium]